MAGMQGKSLFLRLHEAPMHDLTAYVLENVIVAVDGQAVTGDDELELHRDKARELLEVYWKCK